MYGAEELGVYVHVPFCARKCVYCDFYSVANESGKREYISSLLRELADARSAFPGCATTLYFGGGTPSRLGIEEFGEVINAVRSLYALDAGAEITVEVNPDDATPSFFTGLAALGVNRVSVGVQSVDVSVLHFLGRRHTPERGLQAIGWAHAAGIANVSGDVMYGIPGQSEKLVRETCRALAEEGCAHVSAYHLIVEEGSPLGRRRARGFFREVDEEVSVAHYQAVCETLREEGFSHYEVSSYARAGFESRHNSLYWRGGRYVGVGPGAHSYDGARRWWNARSVREYIARTPLGDPPREVEILDAQMRFEEWLLTGLRVAEGVDLQEGDLLFGGDRIRGVRQRAEGWVVRGAVAISAERLRIREGGFMVLDAIVLDLVGAE